MSGIRATRASLVTSWGILLLAVAASVTAPYPLNFVILSGLGLLAKMARRGLPPLPSIPEMIEDDPKYWRLIAGPYYFAIMIGGLFMAFTKPSVINFFIDTSRGNLLLLLFLSFPMAPCIFRRDNRHLSSSMPDPLSLRFRRDFRYGVLGGQCSVELRGRSLASGGPSLNSR